MRLLRAPLLWLYGRWGTFMPRLGIKLGVVVGAPIDLPLSTNPDADTVNRYHAEVCFVVHVRLVVFNVRS
jgi:hypothetical protein